jgi:hypothetical protein
MSSFTVKCAEPVAIVFTGGTSSVPASLALTSTAEAHIANEAADAATIVTAHFLKIGFMFSPVGNRNPTST